MDETMAQRPMRFGFFASNLDGNRAALARWQFEPENRKVRREMLGSGVEVQSGAARDAVQPDIAQRDTIIFERWG